MNWYRIFQGILSVAVLIFIAYRWLRVYQIQKKISTQIIDYYKIKGENILKVRKLSGMEKVKNRISILSEYTNKLYTPLYNNYYRIIELKTDDNTVDERLVNASFIEDRIVVEIVSKSNFNP